MRKIIYSRLDGGVSVVSVPTDTDAALAAAMAGLPSIAIDPQIVSDVVVPTDRTFRNAWIKNGTVVEHDMPKARDLHRETLRQLRAPRLAALDTAYLRADEIGNIAEKVRIAAQKQALRDVTANPSIEAAQTPDELKHVRPAILDT